MKSRFDSRAILVTGAARGIGRAIAIELASRGASVVIADNGAALDGTGPSSQLAHQIAQELCADGFSAVPCTANLATAQGVSDAVVTCLDSFGRIDGIAHVASPCPDLSSPDRFDDGEAEMLFAVNPLAALRMAKLAWPYWKRQAYGRLLLTPSAAVYGAASNAPYAAAKSALLGIVRCLAVDGHPIGVRVNAIMPAARTRMTAHFLGESPPNGYFARMTVEKVAPTATWLLSEDCDVSGETFAVGGGRVARATLSEAIGHTHLETVEEVGPAMRKIMADERWSHPRNLVERSSWTAKIFGE